MRTGKCIRSNPAGPAGDCPVRYIHARNERRGYYPGMSWLAMQDTHHFISGFQEFEYAKAALDYGATDYLLKPVIREELLKAIENA